VQRRLFVPTAHLAGPTRHEAVARTVSCVQPEAVLVSVQVADTVKALLVPAEASVLAFKNLIISSFRLKSMQPRQLALQFATAHSSSSAAGKELDPDIVVGEQLAGGDAVVVQLRASAVGEDILAGAACGACNLPSFTFICRQSCVLSSQVQVPRQAGLPRPVQLLVERAPLLLKVITSREVYLLLHRPTTCAPSLR